MSHDPTPKREGGGGIKKGTPSTPLPTQAGKKNKSKTEHFNFTDSVQRCNSKEKEITFTGRREKIEGGSDHAA